MSGVKTVSNEHTKECKNYPASLKGINFNNLANSMRLPIYFPHIKYQVFISEGMQDLIGQGYILLS